MKWTNPHLVKSKNYDAEHFTTDFGIRFRRLIHPFVRFVIDIAVDRPIELVQYPELEKDVPYLFCAGHSFPGEIASNLSVIDRNAWVLLGTTDQVDHNPQMLAGWANGMIYVDKLKPESRKESMKKMKRILQSGSSILMFPEGVLNNSENLLCMPVYPGFYHLAKETGVKVVPIVSHAEHDAKKILIAAGEPLNFAGKDKVEAMDDLRDTLASLRFDLMERLPPLDRTTLKGDIHLQFLKKRHDTYLETKWVEPNWDEEIVMYHQRGITYAEDVRASFDSVKITASNVAILAPILLRRTQDIKYDIKQYMKDHWIDQ